MTKSRGAQGAAPTGNAAPTDHVDSAAAQPSPDEGTQNIESPPHGELATDQAETNAAPPAPPYEPPPAPPEAPIPASGIPTVTNSVWSLDAARALEEVPSDAEGIDDAVTDDPSRTIEQFMGLDGRTMRIRARVADGALVIQEVKNEGDEA